MPHQYFAHYLDKGAFSEAWGGIYSSGVTLVSLHFYLSEPLTPCQVCLTSGLHSRRHVRRVLGPASISYQDLNPE